MIPVVHLDLRISPRIFEKIRNGLNGILFGWGETDSMKKTRSKKSRDTVPLSYELHAKLSATVCYCITADQNPLPSLHCGVVLVLWTLILC